MRADANTSSAISCNAGFEHQPGLSTSFALRRSDSQSTMCSGKLTVAAGSTYATELDLSAVLTYPTLSLDASALPFGAVLAGASARAHATLTNTGHLPASFSWALAECSAPARATQAMQ